MGNIILDHEKWKILLRWGISQTVLSLFLLNTGVKISVGVTGYKTKDIKNRKERNKKVSLRSYNCPHRKPKRMQDKILETETREAIYDLYVKNNN